MSNTEISDKQKGQGGNRPGTRRRFMGCTALAGTAVIGSVGVGIYGSLKYSHETLQAKEDPDVLQQILLPSQEGSLETLKSVAYRGIRTTDPHGLCGLPNPERSFRTETSIAEPTGRTEGVWGIPAHLGKFVGPGFSPRNWILDIRRFAPDGVTLTQAHCYLTEFHDKPISEEKRNLIRNSFDIMRCIGRGGSHIPPLPDNTRNPIAMNRGLIFRFQDQLRLSL